MIDNEIISIDEAIRHCYEVYLERDDMCKECREEHRQLAKWLEELKASRDLINHQNAEKNYKLRDCPFSPFDEYCTGHCVNCENLSEYLEMRDIIQNEREMTEEE